MQTKVQKSSLTRGPVDRELWYVPDRRIRTQSAARRAAEVAEQIRVRFDPIAEPDEHALFAALHTCAFRATRSLESQSRAVVGREAWFRRWHDIREHIIERNLGLVYSMIRRFNLTNQDEDDRLSDGMYALARAVERFNPWTGYCFSSYACKIIVRALMRGRQHENRYHALMPVQNQVAFERPSGRSDASAGLYAERLNRALEENLAELTKLETKIIALRFPREDNRGLTFREIGEAFGLSKERIRQLQTTALSKLREVLETDPVLQ